MVFLQVQSPMARIVIDSFHFSFTHFSLLSPSSSPPSLSPHFASMPLAPSLSSFPLPSLASFCLAPPAAPCF